MIRRLTLLPLIVLVVGCGSKEPSADAASPSTPGAASGGGAPVKNAPDASAAPGTAYRLAPANPNDPKFKPDPKLAGGG